jgi:hypothetical protein
MEEVNADRKEHGKKPFDSTQKPPEEKEITVSKTDPESGLFQKGEHKKCFAYEAHTACDKHNFVLGVEVTPGNVHDSVAFDAVYDKGGCGQKVGLNTLRKEIEDVFRGTISKSPGGL